MDEKSLMGNERIIELLEELRKNQMQNDMSEVIKLCGYVDTLEHKVDQLSSELGGIRQELKAVRENTLPNHVREQMRVVQTYLKEECGYFKKEILELKREIVAKATNITENLRQKGRNAVTGLMQMTGAKQKIACLQQRIVGAKLDVEDTIERIEDFQKQMEQAKLQKQNAYRSLFGKEQREMQEIQEKNILVKPWKFRHGILQKMEDATVKALEAVRSFEPVYATREQNAERDDVQYVEGEVVDSKDAFAVAENPPEYHTEPFVGLMAAQAGRSALADVIDVEISEPDSGRSR